MEAVYSWGAVALFVGPILAGIALILLRWVFNNGYFLQALLVSGLVGYLVYRHLHPNH